MKGMVEKGGGESMAASGAGEKMHNNSVEERVKTGKIRWRGGRGRFVAKWQALKGDKKRVPRVETVPRGISIPLTEASKGGGGG